MKPRRLALLGLACLVLFLAGSVRTGVVDRDEARFALAVREMAERGDWIVPTNWGELRFQKPILIYWLGGASWRAFGESEFGLRLPSALCATAVVLLTALAGARRFGRETGERAGIVMATTLLIVLQAHAFTADAALLLGTTVSFLAWDALRDRAVDDRGDGSRGPARAGPLRVAFWLGVAFGALAKLVNVGFLLAAGAARVALRGDLSPRTNRLLVAALVVGAVAVAIPGLGSLGPSMAVAVGLFLAVHGLRSAEGRVALANLGPAWGAPLALALVAAWGIPALLRTEGAFWTLGVEQDLIGRTAKPFEGHSGIPGYYLVTSLAMLFPWAAYLPRALGRAWSARRDDDTLQFLLAWIIGPWILIELVTSKLPHYILVATPALALLVAREFEARTYAPAPPPWRRRFETFVVAMVPTALAIAGVVLAVAFDAIWVRAATLAYAAVAAGLAWFLGRAAWQGGGTALLPRLALGSAGLYLATFGFLFPALEPVRIATPLAEAVSANLRPGERLLLHGFKPASVGYALPVRPEIVRHATDVLPALERGPALLAVPNSERKPRLDRLVASQPFAYEHVATVRGYVLWRLREREIWLVRLTDASHATPPPTEDTP